MFVLMILEVFFCGVWDSWLRDMQIPGISTRISFSILLIKMFFFDFFFTGLFVFMFLLIFMANNCTSVEIFPACAVDFEDFMFC